MDKKLTNTNNQNSALKDSGLSKETKKKQDDISKDLKEFCDKNQISIDPKCQFKGNSSLVYYASKGTKSYALKVFYLNREDPNFLHKQNEITREKIFTSNLKNKNCIKCYGCFEMKNSVILILEKCINKGLNFLTEFFYSGNLFKYLNIKREDKKNRGSFLFHMSEGFCKFFFIQILNAIDYLSKNGYTHNSIILSNLFLTLSFQIKLGDFSKYEILNKSEMSLKNDEENEEYMAPENFGRKTIASRFAHKSDLYSAFVCLAKMLFNNFPSKQIYNNLQTNKNNSISEQSTANSINTSEELSTIDVSTPNSSLFASYPHLQEIKERKEKIKMSNELLNLFERGLEPNINKRANISEILNSPWIKRNAGIMKRVHEYHDDDYLKFLIELQKMDYISYYNKEQENIKTLEKNNTYMIQKKIKYFFLKPNRRGRYKA